MGGSKVTDDEYEQMADMLSAFTGQEDPDKPFILETGETLLRKFMYDVFPCDEFDVGFRRLGLNPGSAEVHDMEHEASHDRLDRVADLEVVLVALSALVGRVVSEAMLERNTRPMTEAEEYMFRFQITLAIQAAVVPLIANMIDLKLLSKGDVLK